ncbi:MAG: GNAT family N-acetyltransferase [Candidatus Sulfotelmatobacter sp.]
MTRFFGTGSVSKLTHYQGVQWGNNGFGSIAYDVFRATHIESWTQLFAGNKVWTGPKSGIALRNWGLKETTGGVVQGCELVGPGEEKRAWSYAVEVNGALEVEELFVMPQFRRRGYGKKLLRVMESAAKQIRAPLRLWISHADANPTV